MISFKEEYAGLYYSRSDAEVAAKELQAAGRQTKVEESQYHLGTFVLYATRQD